MDIYLSEDMFSYELQALVKAFYPVDTHGVEIGEPGAEDDYVWVTYTDKEVSVELVENGESQAKVTEPIDRENRRLCKDSVKRAIYKALSHGEEGVVPWGTLTGVRPTKLIMELVNQGCTEEEVIAEMHKR